MNYEIREANKHDYAGISQLTMEVYNLHLKNRPDVYLDIENPLSKEFFNDLLNSNTTNIFIVENTDNKQLVAYSILQIMNTKNPIYIPKKYIYIDDFCVKSTLKRTGIGKLLFNHIVDYAKLENAAALQLNVWEFNQDALKFYESMGMNTRNRMMELNF
ncbi:GNAT family N-acetyltransferase [Inconstantimicrobium mannanitabidum]|uniref:N-acetyltransferase n=1 Tax=Inconstantimicrobium mannanitabidum TaxID=1604901 RepID=A0ACB5R7Z9_9CLOT|nr:GNAT family N-acetyltransferase [Clostridium sp. TW13]GKX65287.1 N-acetyltransferase [Clostridium sp. TW13]